MKKYVSLIALPFLFLIIFSTMTSDVKVADTIVEQKEQPQEVSIEDIHAADPESLPTNTKGSMIEEATRPQVVIRENPSKELILRNNDYVGWIVLEDTNIHNPIVKGKDNTYYLDRNFDKAYDQKGSIYMDHRNFGFGIDRHIILYGHNMKDGSMFGDLKLYKDPSYGQAHPIIEIQDLFTTRRYKVFSSYYEEASSDALQLGLDSIEHGTYIETLLNKSQLEYEVLVNLNSSILTLVTCTYEVDDGRYFVHAVELEE